MLEVAMQESILKSIIYPLIYILGVLIAISLCKNFFKRINNFIMECTFYIIVGSIVILFVSPGYVLGKEHVGSMVLIEFLQVAVAVITIRSVKYVKLDIADYILMLIIVFMIREYCYPKVFGRSMMFLSSFSILCLIMKSKYGDIKRLSLQIDVSFLSSVFVYCIYFYIYEKGLSELYYKVSQSFNLYQKVMLLFVMALILLATMYLLILGIKRGLNLYFIKLQNFSEKYKEIGYYLISIPYFIGILFLLLDGLFIRKINDYSQVNIWKLCIILLFIGTQVFYIKLLSTTIRLKEHIEYKENEQDNLTLYNENLNKNIQDIREVKHDLKNIFLTMGEYVARSNDNEFKEYYYEKIAPYAKNEIKMNDIYVSLQDIKNESIKSFLYYKILQCMDNKIEIQLDSKSDHSLLPYIADISTISRILGIFIDNAIEECAKQDRGIMSINIAELKGNVSFTVKNSVRDTIKKNGIYIGVTNKGLGRGNGLKIVEKLVKKHSDILWNYYFNDNIYVQSITIIRNKEA